MALLELFSSDLGIALKIRGGSQMVKRRERLPSQSYSLSPLLWAPGSGWLVPRARTASSKTMSPRSTMGRSDVSSWLAATPPERPSTSWRVTGHRVRCCSFPAYWPKGSPALPFRSTSPLANH